MEADDSLYFLFLVLTCKYFSTFQEWSFLPFAMERFPALEGNPFYGHCAKPRLSDRGFPCKAICAGSMPGGSNTHDVHFTDEHPLVKWIVALLDGKDLSQELHNAPSQTDGLHDEHNVGGMGWLMGDTLPGPHVPLSTIRAVQRVDEVVTDFRVSATEFLVSAGLQESQARGMPNINPNQTDYQISSKHHSSIQAQEFQAIKLVRDLAATEITISKLAAITNKYVQLHTDVRMRLKAALATIEGIHNAWITDASACQTNAVGQQCRNSLAEYGNLMQAISSAAARGPPIWGPLESNNRGPLNPTYCRDRRTSYDNKEMGLSTMEALVRAAAFMSKH